MLTTMARFVGSFQPASPSSPHPTTTNLTSPSNIPEGTSSPSTSTSSPSVPHPTKPADHNNSPTLLTIDLSFSFANPLHRIASQAFLPKVSDLMVEAFEKRCVQVYGKGKN
jgi:coenzyme Q-binding protein COQ10